MRHWVNQHGSGTTAHGEDPPLSPAITTYLAAFTRSILASKSTASDEERAAADAERADALDVLLDATGIDRDREGRIEPHHSHSLALRHSPRRHNLGRWDRRVRRAA